MSIYNKFSKIYDNLMYDCDYELWSQYLLSRIKKDCDGTIRGVDFACGSGTMTILLKKGGLDIMGVDISEGMISKAQEKSRNMGVRLNFILSDVVEFKSPKKLQFVTMCLDGVNYIDKDRIKSLFVNVYNNLNDNGKFFFDVSTVYKLSDFIGENVFYDDGEDVTYLWTNEQKENSVDFNIVFFVKNEKGLYQRFDESHTLYKYSKDELNALLLESGFNKVEFISENFDKNFKKEDMRLHVICTK